MHSPFLIRSQAPGDLTAVIQLQQQAFGPGRFARSAYRVREASTGEQIALTAWDGPVLAGAIQLTAITIGARPGAMLLGPLAIAPAYKGMGCGQRLIREGLEAARAAGKRLVVLVGDLPYYGRTGFTSTPLGRIQLPGPADPARILAVELTPGAIAEFAGVIAADNTPAPALAAASFRRTGFLPSWSSTLAMSIAP